MPLSELAIDQLEELLFDEQLSEDTLDYFGLHGLVCAAVVGPVNMETQELIDVCMADQDLGDLADKSEHLANCIEVIKVELLEALSEGTTIYLPFEEEDDDTYHDALTSWCAGFVEGLLHNEDAWLAEKEDAAAELLLPYMALSGLFENDEFAQILSNKKLMAQFESVVSEQLTDVFLFYHS